MANFLALEIQTDQLVIAVARSSGRRMQLEQATTLPISTQSIEALGDAVKKFLQQHRIPKCDTIGVIARKNAEIRMLDVPPVPDNELPDLIRFKAKSDFGALNDNWALDFVPCSDDATQPRKILATAIAPTHIETFEKICEACGLKLKHVLFKPFATVDLLRSRLLDGDPRLILDASDTDWNLTVSRGCEILVTRSVKKVTEDPAKHLVNNVKRTLAAARQELDSKAITEVLISGELGSLADAVREQVDVPCEVVDPFQFTPTKSRFERPGNTSQFTGVLGALLQHESGLGHEVDYLNPRKVEIKQINYKRIGFLVGLAAVAVIGLGILGWFVLRSQANELKLVQQRLTKAKAENAGTVDGKQERPSSDQIIQEVGTIDKWKAADINWLDEITEISNRFMTPDQVIVDSLEASLRREQPSIRIEGRVSDSETDRTLRDNLIARPYQVVSPKSTRTGEATYQQYFEYTLTPEKNLPATIKKMDARTREYVKELQEQQKARRQSDSTP